MCRKTLISRFGLIGQYTPVLALYDPFGVDVPLNFDVTGYGAARHLQNSWSYFIHTAGGMAAAIDRRQCIYWSRQVAWWGWRSRYIAVKIMKADVHWWMHDSFWVAFSPMTKLGEQVSSLMDRVKVSFPQARSRSKLIYWSVRIRLFILVSIWWPRRTGASTLPPGGSTCS